MASSHSRTARAGSVEKFAASAASRSTAARPPSTRLPASGIASTSWTARSKCLDASTNAPAAMAAWPAQTDARSAIGRSSAASAWWATSASRAALGACPVAGGRLEGPGIGQVVAAALARQQAVVDRLLQQGVTERVAVSRRDDQLRIERRPERRLDVQLRRGDHRRDRGLVDADARDRHRLDDDPRVVWQRRDAGEEHLGDARAPRHPARRVERRQQLLGDERVAAGALDELVHEGLLRRPAEDRLGLDGHLVAPEPAELQDLDRRHPRELGDPGQQRVAAMELVAPVREHDRAGPAAAPHEVPDEVERRGVRPVEVLEHDHERPIRGGPLEAASEPRRTRDPG